MLENEFFPTPQSVIELMLKPLATDYSKGSYRYRCYLDYKQSILEPSGGSGAILDYLKDELNVNVKDLYTIELNSDLRFTLQAKGYKVIGTDFLAYDEPTTFGLILMNPPFSSGVKHVLKAWRLLADGGYLVALVNAETVFNVCSKERELLECLIEDFGTVESLGQCFKDAERSTDVEVSLIRLHKPDKQVTFTFDDLGFSTDKPLGAEEFSANPLAHADAIKDLVARYNATRAILLQRHESQSKLSFYLNGIDRPVYESSSSDKAKSLEQDININTQMEILKSRFWNTVFTQTKLGSKTTSDFRAKFQDFTTSQASMSFNEENIREMLNLFFLNKDQIMQDCIVEVFDKATAYHEKNKVHTEGWKTNKSYRVNKRIIIPNGVTFDNWGFKSNYYLGGFLNDLDKVMIWLSGYPESEGNTYRMLEDFCRGCTDYTQKFNNRFFQMKIFKKGTLHLDFLDLDLLAEFNKRAAEGKQWLGGGY